MDIIGKKLNIKQGTVGNRLSIYLKFQWATDWNIDFYFYLSSFDYVKVKLIGEIAILLLAQILFHISHVSKQMKTVKTCC